MTHIKPGDHVRHISRPNIHGVVTIVRQLRNSTGHYRTAVYITGHRGAYSPDQLDVVKGRASNVAPFTAVEAVTAEATTDTADDADWGDVDLDDYLTAVTTSNIDVAAFGLEVRVQVRRRA